MRASWNYNCAGWHTPLYLLDYVCVPFSPWLCRTERWKVRSNSNSSDWQKHEDGQRFLCSNQVFMFLPLQTKQVHGRNPKEDQAQFLCTYVLYPHSTLHPRLEVGTGKVRESTTFFLRIRPNSKNKWNFWIPILLLRFSSYI
jgi:hypothetical protein